MNIFRKLYTLRRFGEQTIADGHASAPHTDISVMLNVQPLNSDELQTLSEGERVVKRIKAFGDRQVSTANQYTGTPGDWLFYSGHWYECVSSVRWDHTMLAHYRSEFVLAPEGVDPP
jgi:hypothetical protein